MGLELDFTVDRGAFVLDTRLKLPGRGVTALFGRSGSGKTTLLRCIAGLERPAGGVLSFKGEVWQNAQRFRPTWKRPLGYVFQEASLFPHLRVMGNLDYGYRRVPAGERRIHKSEVIRLLGLEALLDRFPNEISGGQRQRVAIGRALLTSPRLLLMDEPLASLDVASKEEILPFLERLRDELEMPVVYVSHSIDEVMRLADHMILLDEGRVLAEGGLQELLTHPELPFLQAEGASAVLRGRVSGLETADGLVELDVEGQPVLVGCPEAAAGRTVRLRVMARDVALALTPPKDSSFINCLKVRLLDSRPGVLPSQLLVRLALGEQILLARVPHRTARMLDLRPGLELHALVRGMTAG